MKKKLIIGGSILLVILILIVSFFVYKNEQEKKRKLEEQKIEARYEKVYNSSYELIKDDVTEQELNLKTEDENIIYKFFDNISEEKEGLKQITYDEFIKENDISKLYEDPSEYIKKLEEYNSRFDTIKKEIEDTANKDAFIAYLKNNDCSDKGIKILNKKVKSEELKFNSEEINNIQNSNIEKTNTLTEYVTYLNGNKDNWYLKDNKVIAKTDEVLNKINEKNKIFNINITTEKEKSKVTVNNSKKIPVIMYHGVSDETWGLEGLFMKVSDFEEEMKYLSDNGFETIFIEDIEKDYTGKKVVALTFDDGYVDFYTNVLPIIKKYNIKTNLYIIVSSTYGNEKFLLPEQIKEISNSGLVSIGSHTVSHNKLATLSNDQIESELQESKEYLENLLGKEIKTICYPSGSYNSDVLNIAKKHYTYGLTTINGIQSMSSFSQYKIIRRGMYRSSGMNTFKNIVNNAN